MWLQLEMFEIKSNDKDAIISLRVKESRPRSDSKKFENSESQPPTAQQKESNGLSVGSLKNKLKLFECNYELKFKNKQSKYVVFLLC